MKQATINFLKDNPYQKSAINVLFSLYESYKNLKTNNNSILNNFFTAFNYPIENALLSHYAVWLNEKTNNGVKFVSIEEITQRCFKQNIKDFNNIAITKSAMVELSRHYNAHSKMSANKYIHWEHLTPKSVIYKNLKELFNNKNQYNYDDFCDELVDNVLYKNKLLIMSKCERDFFDRKKWSLKYKPTMKNKPTINKIRGFMRCKAEALTRLYFLSLINPSPQIEISFDNGKSSSHISSLIDVKNPTFQIQPGTKILTDAMYDITAKGDLLKYFSNYQR